MTVTLTINAWGDPDLMMTKQDKLKQDKVLKAIPPAAKKSGGCSLDRAQNRDRAAGVPHAAIA